MYLFEDIWHYMGFGFNKVIQQYTENTTQAYYSDCNIQLNHNTNMFPITGPCMLTIVTLGVPSDWEGVCG